MRETVPQLVEDSMAKQEEKEMEKHKKDMDNPREEDMEKGEENTEEENMGDTGKEEIREEDMVKDKSSKWTHGGGQEALSRRRNSHG